MSEVAELERWAGRTLIGGFPGTEATPELRRRLGAGRLGGVILFARNIDSPEQVAELCMTLRGSAPTGAPLLTSIDQEGGRVQRLRAPATEWPPMALVGRRRQVDGTHRLGRALARELRAVGVTVDFAPVLDVHTNPANPVIGDRAFGTEPRQVSAHGLALARGLEAGGVCACGKHFPGHGDTHQDSHLDLPVVEHDPARLRAVELRPFADAVAGGIPMIMTAHVLYPQLDADHPATMSPTILGILRQELGYAGVVVSDDLEMKAVADRYGIEETVVQALAAGCDAFLICHDAELQDRALAALVRAAEAKTALRARLEEAAARVTALARRYAGEAYLPPQRLPEHVGSPSHLALAAELAGGDES